MVYNMHYIMSRATGARALASSPLCMRNEHYYITLDYIRLYYSESMIVAPEPLQCLTTDLLSDGE